MLIKGNCCAVSGFVTSRVEWECVDDTLQYKQKEAMLHKTWKFLHTHQTYKQQSIFSSTFILFTMLLFWTQRTEWRETSTHKRHAATAAVTHITNTTSSSAAITTTLLPPHMSCLYKPLFRPFHLFCIYLQINAIQAMMLNVGDSSFAKKQYVLVVMSLYARLILDNWEKILKEKWENCCLRKEANSTIKEEKNLFHFAFHDYEGGGGGWWDDDDGDHCDGKQICKIEKNTNTHTSTKDEFLCILSWVLTIFLLNS